MSARAFRRSRARRVERERRRLTNATRRALVAGVTLGASAVFATSAEAATYAVNSTADNGTGTCNPSPALCTLRDAITTANANGTAGTPDTIDLSGVTGTITLDPTKGALSVTDPGGINIDGPGSGTLAVSGGGATGIFQVNAGAAAPVSISGLTLTAGSSSGNGGAIDAQTSPLTLTNDTISGNTSTGGEGGGIYSRDALTISSSTITGNTATGGGGIFAVGKYSLTIQNSTISANSAQDGGGIVGLGTKVSITGSHIDDNQATNGVGGGIDAFAGSLSVTGSTVSGDATAESGGGILSQTKYGTTIDSSTVSNNTAANGGGLDILGENFLGSSPGANPVLVQESTIAGNHAPMGAGIEVGDDKGPTPVTVKASTISGNQGGSGSFGGGLLLARSVDNPFDLVDSTISGNTATDGGGVSLSYGGSTTPLVGTGGSISFDNSTIDRNAAARYGGGVYLGQYNSGSRDQSGTASINSTIVADNTAAGDPPNDLFRPSTSTSGGFDTAFSLIQNPGNAPLLSSQSLITGVSPRLGVLANNGGPTQTMLPSNTSPVIDQGHAESGLTTDQRGDPRTVDNGKPKPPGGDGTDIGAVELGLIPPIPTPTPTPSPTPSSPSIAATIGPATSVTTSSAVLHGTITTSGEALTWYFEYGTNTPNDPRTASRSISAGHGDVPVSFKVKGLKRDTRYRYRLVAVSSSGHTVDSAYASFKTAAPTIKVKPGAVLAGGEVRVFGSAGACTRGDRVTLISRAFSPAHKFAGVNAVYAKVGAGSRYAVLTRIPAGRAPTRYAITARCGGGNFGVMAFLRVLAPPPIARFTG